MLNKDGELFFKKDNFEDIFDYYFGSIVGNLNVEQWNGNSTTSSISNRLNDVMILSKIMLTAVVQKT